MYSTKINRILSYLQITHTNTHRHTHIHHQQASISSRMCYRLTFHFKFFLTEPNQNSFNENLKPAPAPPPTNKPTTHQRNSSFCSSFNILRSVHFLVRVYVSLGRVYVFHVSIQQRQTRSGKNEKKRSRKTKHDKKIVQPTEWTKGFFSSCLARGLFRQEPVVPQKEERGRGRGRREKSTSQKGKNPGKPGIW